MIKPARHILSLEPYNLSKRDLFEDNFIKLDWNETLFPLNAKLRNYLVKEISQSHLNLYPKLINKDLQIKLSEYAEVASESISVFPGSDVALDYICRTYLEKGDIAVSIGPTYDNFRIFVASTGATHEIILPNSLDEYSLKDKISKIKKKPKIIYFSNPNNPMSFFTEKSELEKCLSLNKDTLFICDEAYFEFSKISMTNLINNYQNIIFSRSFSKGLGLAGLRIGYLITNSQIIENINKIKNFKNLTSISQSSAIFVLENLDILDERIKDIEKSKEIILNFLKDRQLKFFSGNTNFVLIDVKDHPKIKDNLYLKKFITREFNSNILNGHIRITYPQSIHAIRLCETIEEVF